MENWRWLGHKIRCALEPEEPRLIEYFIAEGRHLARYAVLPAWQVAETTLDLLLDSCRDPILPWHWREQCLDAVWRPLDDLRRISGSDPSRTRRLQDFTWQMANLRLLPSLSSSELAEGNSHYE